MGGRVKALLTAACISLLPFSHAKGFILETAKLSYTKPSLDLKLKSSDTFKVPTGGEKGFSISYSAQNVPIIPDIRIKYTHLYSSSSRILTADTDVAGTSLSKGTKVESKVNANNVKLTLFTQPLDPFNYDFINVEVGVNLNFIDYDFKFNYYYGTSSSSDEKTISTMIPSLHFKVSITPTYFLELFVRGALPLGSKRDKELEGGVNYYLNSQLFLFASYQYQMEKVDNINGLDFKANNRLTNLGLGVLW
ncbi:hypothetical protein [Thermovibrio sp.]